MRPQTVSLRSAVVVGDEIRVAWSGGGVLFPQVSEFEEGPVFLNAAGFDAASNRPVYSFAAPTVIEQTVFGENPSGAQAGTNRSRWTMQLGAKYRF